LVTWMLISVLFPYLCAELCLLLLLQEVLSWLLADPVQKGLGLGLLVDGVADLQRLERTVPRNDEVNGASSQPYVTSIYHAGHVVLHCLTVLVITQLSVLGRSLWWLLW